MRLTVVLGVLTAALTLGGCGDDNDGPPDAPRPASPTSADTGPDSLALAEVTATAFYDAVGRRDCIVMRGLSTLDEQREDNAWGVCIDTLLAVVGDDFSYRVVDDTGDGSRITFTVASTSTIDGAVVEREDPLVLELVGESWLVDDSIVTAGG